MHGPPNVKINQFICVFARN